MTILELLEQAGIKTRKESHKEFSSACPKCGGNDRFRIFVNENRWLCRTCNKSGDVIQFLRDFQDKSFKEACEITGDRNKLNSSCMIDFKPKSWTPAAKFEPDDIYQRQAKTFIEQSNISLLNNSEVLEWLKTERGINLETVKKFNLGWNERVNYLSRESWGLPTELKENGQAKKLFLPAGLVIPVMRSGKIFRIKVRRSNIKPGEAKYIFLPGGSDIPLTTGKGEYCVICESELDAILLSQEVSGIVCIALGSCSNKPDKETDDLIRKCKGIFLSFDSDLSGAKASFNEFWQDNFQDRNHLFIPKKYGKDITDLFLSGISLKDWVGVGIEKINSKISDSKVKSDSTTGTLTPSLETNKMKESIPCSDRKVIPSAGKVEPLPDLLTLNKTIFDLSTRLIHLSTGVSSGSKRYQMIDQAINYLQDVENFDLPKNTIPVILEAIGKAQKIIAELSR